LGILSLPHELTAEQRKWLVTDFAREMARKGMVVDACIHKPHAKDRKEHDRSVHNDERNYHVHMLVTMRELNENGFGNKVREWNQRSEIEMLRERWSELGSKALHRAGFHLEAERYAEGHHTLKVQRVKAVERGDTEFAAELDREPSRSLGPHASAMERRGVRTVNGDINRDIEERNLGRALTKDLGRQMGKADQVHPALKRGIMKGPQVILESVANALDSLISPKLTPEQRRQADDANIQRQLDEQDATHTRNQGRGRDR
jgi:MobA/MobL family